MGNIQETSREAYRTHPTKGTQEKRVVELLLERTKAGKWTGINDVAKSLSWEKSTASARLNKVKSYGEIHHNGRIYQVVQSVNPIQCQYSGKRVNKYSLVLKQSNPGTQSAMF